MNGPLLPRPLFWAEAARQKQTRYTLIGELLAFLLVFLIASVVQTFLIAGCTLIWLLSTQSDLLRELSTATDLNAIIDTLLESLPDWLLFLVLFANAAYGVAAVFYCRMFEKRSLATMGLRRKGAAAEFGLGLAIGLLLVLAVVGIGTAAKGFRVGAFSLDAASLPFLLLTILGYLVEAAAMELICRGYLATSLGTRLPVTLTVILAAFLPTIFSNGISTLSTIGFINALLLSVLLIVYMIKRGNLWGCCAIHAMWNIGLHILFDFTKEGSVGAFTVFPVYTVPSNTVMTGGEFGPEASICATIALLAGIAVLLALKPRDAAPAEPEDEDPEASEEG